MVQESSFSEGDLVRLKEGGPLMSVKFGVADLFLCTWTDDDGRTRRGTYSSDELDPVDERTAVCLDVLARLATRWPVVAAC